MRRVVGTSSASVSADAVAGARGVTGAGGSAGAGGAAVGAVPAGLWNAHGFAVFNALSWQIVLGPPVILFAKGLGAMATVWVGGRLCEVWDSPRVLRGCVLGLLVAVAGWAAAMVSRLPQGPPLNPPYSRHTPKAPCAEHGAAPSPLRPSAGR